MPSWRLSALGAGSKIRAALLPVPAVDAGAWQSRGPISGSPGITRIPAVAPLPRVDSELTALANAGNIGLPSSAFNYWLPGVYYAWPASRAPVSVFSDNQMPVPAIDPRGLPAVVMPGPVMQGQRQTSTPRVAPKFPTRTKGHGRR